jgi:CHASE2 domain-containing sensor protein
MERKKAHNLDTPKEAAPAQRWAKTAREYGNKLLELLVLGLPIALATKVFDYVSGTFIKQPWQAMWFLAPLAVSVWVVWQILKGRGEFKINRPFLLFLTVYVVLFSVAAATNFLDWSHNITVFGEKAPRTWLMPTSAGDWRYLLVRREDASKSGLVIVTLMPPHGQSIESTRYDIARLIAIAKRVRAKGVALDLYFERASNVDTLLCQVIEDANIPVIVGYGFHRNQNDIVPTALPDNLNGCITTARQGHLAGFMNPDHKIRSVPLLYGNRPAFSLVVARTLASLAGRPDDIEPPDDGLLRFVEPEHSFQTVPFEKLVTDPNIAAMLTDRFVLTGEDSERETLETPFGQKLGVQIHADAIHSLLQHCYIRSTPWWSSLFVILVACYLLTVNAAHGYPKRRLINFCLVVSLTIVGISCIAIIAGHVWFDIVYPIFAIWLLLPMLLTFRQLEASRRGE